MVAAMMRRTDKTRRSLLSHVDLEDQILFRQVQQPVLHGRPNECVVFQPLVGHHQPSAIPVKQPQPICLLGTEHEDRACERALAQRVLNLRGQTVTALAKVDALGRHHDPHPVRRKDRTQARRAMTNSATQAAGVAASNRTVTGK